MIIDSKRQFFGALRAEVEVASAIDTDDHSPLSRTYTTYVVQNYSNVQVRTGSIPNDTREDPPYTHYIQVTSPLTISTYEGFAQADIPEYSNFLVWRQTDVTYRLVQVFTCESVYSIKYIPSLSALKINVGSAASPSLIPLPTAASLISTYGCHAISSVSNHVLLVDNVWNTTPTVLLPTSVISFNPDLNYNYTTDVTVGHLYGKLHSTSVTMTSLPTVSWRTDYPGSAGVKTPPTSILPSGIVIEEFNPISI